MSIQKNSPIDPEQFLKKLIDETSGIIRSGLCNTPEYQKEFDDRQKNKPPETE